MPIKYRLIKVGFKPILFFVILGSAQLGAQINTETYRQENLKKGIHFSAGGDIGYVEGNSSIFQNGSTGWLDYIQDWGYIFAVTNYQIKMKDKKLFLNKGFSHLRVVKSGKEPRSIELFLQQEFNEFIQLESRSLAGLGLRINWNPKQSQATETSKVLVFSGFGLMVEREIIDSGPDGNLGDPVHGDKIILLRSTNYLVLNWNPTPAIKILTTTYYQPDVKRWVDYRILNRVTLKIDLTKRLSATLNFNMRYDSEPPGTIKHLDIDINNGFSYNFK
ncbi:MAG: DUF481 domain-containing protein [Candidatus Marinimicrobia bacterium]|nr:DUF481 domain-containing protein [Candidatus Neomarinimicrobiota bacterium]